MNTSPLVSIIVPVYNEEEVVADCMNSVLDQTYENWELIMVDDGSSDCSLEVIERTKNKFGNRCLVIKSEHCGPSHARNIGIAQSRGEFIAFVDADDVILPDYLKILLHPMQSNDAIDVCICAAKQVTAGGEERLLLEWEREGIISKAESIKHLFCTHIIDNLWGKCFRRRIISSDQCDERFFFGEDLLAMWTILNKADGIYYIPSVQYYWRIRASGICASLPIVDRNYELLRVLATIGKSFYFKGADMRVKSAMYDLVLKECQMMMREYILNAGSSNRKIAEFFHNQKKLWDNAFERKLFAPWMEKRYGFAYSWLIGAKDIARENNVLIYGTGNAAMKIFDFLVIRIGVEKIKGFIVSEEYYEEYFKENHILKGKDVKRLDEWEETQKCILILAMRINLVEEVFPHCVQKDFLKILIY